LYYPILNLILIKKKRLPIARLPVVAGFTMSARRVNAHSDLTPKAQKEMRVGNLKDNSSLMTIRVTSSTLVK